MVAFLKIDLFSIPGKSAEAASPALVRWLGANKSSGIPVLNRLLPLDHSPRCWSKVLAGAPAITVMVKGAGWKKGQRAEVRAFSSSLLGSVTGSCHTKLSFPPCWPELSHITHVDAREAEKHCICSRWPCAILLLLWDDGEGKQAVSAVVRRSDLRPLWRTHLMN